MSNTLRARQRALLERSHRYRRLALDPHIGSRTLFFHAAHIVTRMLSFGHPTPFMAGLSADLEELNLSLAQRLCRGDFPRTLEESTREFIRLEQAYVEDALGRLCAASSAAVTEEIARMNLALHRAASRGAALLSPTHRIFRRAVLETWRRLGRFPDFACQQHRQALGLEIAYADCDQVSPALREPRHLRSVFHLHGPWRE